MMSEEDDSMSSTFSIDQFETYCSSDILLIDELRRMTEGLPLDDLNNSTFLHRVSMNELVTLEIVEYLLDFYPQAVNFKRGIPEEYIFSAYPLHLACYNKKCPNEVIQLLLEKIEESKLERLQLETICHIDYDWGNTGIDLIEGEYHGGVPLHFYLSRTSNVDLDIVKQLVTTNPEMLLLTDVNSRCTPLHILMYNHNIGELYDVVKQLSEPNPSSLLARDRYDQTPLNVACASANKHMTAKIIELLLQVCPDSIRQPNNWGGLPIHSLCEARMDDEIATDIVKLLLEAHPDSVTRTTDDGGELPLHIAAYNKPPAFCKALVDAYPESVRRGNNIEELPFHNACNGGRPDTLEYLFKLYPESLHIRNYDGYLPIHCAANSPGDNTAEIIEFLLLHDPECLSKPVVSDNRGNQYQQGNGASTRRLFLLESVSR